MQTALVASDFAGWRCLEYRDGPAASDNPQVILQTPTSAAIEADENRSKNLAALEGAAWAKARRAQSYPAECEWAFGRDGTLTARIEDRWRGDASAPRVAARALLRTFEPRGALSCLLAPSHPAQIAVCLERLMPNQALLVLLPDEQEFEFALSAIAVAAEIRDLRLYFAAGDDWAIELENIFDVMTGLPTPNQFIRVATVAEDLAVATITTAQQVFSRVNAGRAEAVAQMRCDVASVDRSGRVLIVAPLMFRLWDDHGDTLVRALKSSSDERIVFDILDIDRPAMASSFMLANRSRACQAVVAINAARTDLPDVLDPGMPVMTWVTGPRIPPPGSNPMDALLLADSSMTPAAISAGWDASRVIAAPAPSMLCGLDREDRLARVPGVIITDTIDISRPPLVFEYSSHGVLWALIRDELTADPWKLSNNPRDYLDAQMRRLSIGDEGFNRSLFLNGLIPAALAQGVARTVMREKIPLCIFGVGWENVPDCASVWRGVVESREGLHEAMKSAGALIWTWCENQPCIDGLNVIDALRVGRVGLISGLRRPQYRNCSTGSGRDGKSFMGPAVIRQMMTRG